MNRLRLALLLLLTAAAVIGALQNTEVVAVRFLFWEARASQVVVTLLALGTGFLLGVLALLLARR